MAGAWARVGNVRSVNPARRELRIDPAKTFEDGVRGAKAVRVALNGGEHVVCQVDSVNANPGGLIVTLGAGVSRDIVARMKGANVDVERQRQRRDAVAPGEMAAEDWIGLNVIGADGACIGTVRGVIDSPAHDILEIETPDGRELLLPAIIQTVESIDLETRTVTVGDIAPYGIADAD